MSVTPGRHVLSLFLAYTFVVILCIPAGRPTASASSGLTNPRKSSRPLLNSPNRIRVSAQNSPRSGRRERELLIKFRPKATLEEQKSLLTSIGARDFRTLRGKSRVVRVVLNQSQTIESAALSLQNQTLVEAAEPNYLIYQDNASSSKASSATSLRRQQVSTRMTRGLENSGRYKIPVAIIGCSARMFR